MQVEIGNVYSGKITGIMNFGAFVQLESGQSGLVHISEIARDFVKDIKEHVKIGDPVKVKVLAIDENKKIKLSIKKALPPEEPKEVAAPKQANMSFEDMLSSFKTSSDEKLRSLNVDPKRRRANA